MLSDIKLKKFFKMNSKLPTLLIVGIILSNLAAVCADTIAFSGPREEVVGYYENLKNHIEDAGLEVQANSKIDKAPATFKDFSFSSLEQNDSYQKWLNSRLAKQAAATCPSASDPSV